jgi:ribonuclease HI
MAKNNKSKYYVVWVGQKPGIYNSWAECQAQVVGYPDAKYKSFKQLEEAEAAFRSKPNTFLQRNKKVSKEGKATTYNPNIIADSISVDAACSGNPGIMEYRGVNTISKEELFLKGPYRDGTNNVGEFLALVHGLALLKKQNNTRSIIYTDSKTAMSWVRNKKVKTTLSRTDKNKEIFQLMERALSWLEKNDYVTRIVKWDTAKWGEIPADFGRK